MRDIAVAGERRVVVERDDGNARKQLKQQWTVRARVTMGMTAVCVLMGAAIGMAVFDAEKAMARAEGALEVAERDRFMATREADHLNWVKNLSVALLGGGEFKGELNPRKCKLGQWIYSEGEQRLIDDPEIRRRVAEAEEAHRRMHESAAQVLTAHQQSGDEAALAAFQSHTAPALKATGAAIQAIRECYQAEAKQQGAALMEELKEGRQEQIGFGLAGLLVAVGISFVLVRTLNSRLLVAVSELAGGAEQVLTAAGHVSAGSQSLAQGASEQAASIEETAAASKEVRGAAQRGGESTREAAQVVEESRRRFEQVHGKLDEMEGAMGGIRAQSDKISQIIRTIDEIAFQTNILALNAAVEAARAGEAGMGFAVVADEVRNLAQRCARAAQETSAMIAESIAKSKDGQAKVDEVAAAIRAVTGEVDRLSVLIGQLKAGNQEQARSVDHIATSLEQIERATHHTASGAEQSASAAEELNAQAATMQGVVESLRALVGY